MSSEFPCLSCGACCRAVGYSASFPLPIRADGSCSELLPDNTCAIYATRPEICRVDVNADASELGREEYFRVSAVACGQLMEREGKKIYGALKVLADQNT